MGEEPAEEPEITTIGAGEVVGAVVGGVHGDEPSGVTAIERTLESIGTNELELERAIRFVIANPPAIAAGTRFVEKDMNRSFPGDPDGTLEERLAAIVCEAVKAIPTLAMHATRSSGTPFAFAPPGNQTAIDLVSALSVPNLVLADGAEIGSLSACGTVITVESGTQGTAEAANTATSLVKEFLVALGALDGTPQRSEPTVFELGSEIDRPPGTDYEVLVENFTRVMPGEAFASVDGKELRAEEAFYPILLSEDGYEDILGFRGFKLADSPREIAGDRY